MSVGGPPRGQQHPPFAHAHARHSPVTLHLELRADVAHLSRGSLDAQRGTALMPPESTYKVPASSVTRSRLSKRRRVWRSRRSDSESPKVSATRPSPSPASCPRESAAPRARWFGARPRQRIARQRRDARHELAAPRGSGRCVHRSTPARRCPPRCAKPSIGLSRERRGAARAVRACGSRIPAPPPRALHAFGRGMSRPPASLISRSIERSESGGSWRQCSVRAAGQQRECLAKRVACPRQQGLGGLGAAAHLARDLADAHVAQVLALEDFGVRRR